MTIDGAMYGIPGEYEITDPVAQRILALGEVFGRDDPVLLAYVRSTLGVDPATPLPTTTQPHNRTEEEFAEGFAARIRVYRSKHGLPQVRMAEHCGVKMSQLVDWERQRAYPSASGYARVAAKIGLEWEYVQAKRSRVREERVRNSDVGWPRTVVDDQDKARAALFSRWAEALTAFKEAGGMSDKELSEELDCGGSTAHAWRRNQRPPSFVNYAKVCRVIGFTEPYIPTARETEAEKRKEAAARRRAEPAWERDQLADYLADYDVELEDLADLFGVSAEDVDDWAYGELKPPRDVARHLRDLCSGRRSFMQISSDKAPTPL